MPQGDGAAELQLLLSVAAGALVIKTVPDKFQTSPKKTHLGERRKLGHNLSLKICKSLHYSALARETDGLGEGGPHRQSRQRAIFCRLMKDGERA